MIVSKTVSAAAVSLALAALLVSSACSTATTVKAAVKSDKERKAAPEFTLKDSNGQTVHLSDYKGKVVLLDFWATWCGPCRIEIPGFVQLQNKYGSQGLVVVGLSMDDGPEPVRMFYSSFHMNYPVAMGSDKLGMLYGGIFGLPTTFLIGRDGRIYAKHEGLTDLSVFEKEIKELLAAPPDRKVADFKTVGYTASKEIQTSTPAEVNSVVPGVDVSKLSPAELKEFEKLLAQQKCTCGCGFTVLKCRQVDSSCQVSLREAKDAYQKFLKSHHG
jgi:peroxiredoxin